MLPIIDELQNTFKPPYQLKDLFSVFIALFIMITIPLTVLEVTSQRDTRTNASVFDNSAFTKTLQVSIVSPLENQIVSGAVDINVKAVDSSVAVNSLSITADGKLLAKINNPASTSEFNTTFSWDTTKEKNGPQNLVVTATNSDNKTNRSQATRINVINTDTVSPTVSFANLEDEGYISGSSYQIKLAAADNLGLASVKLTIDNTVVKVFTTLPYTYNWDLNNVSTGTHTLEASATDFSGNSTSTKIQIYKGIKGIKN